MPSIDATEYVAETIPTLYILMKNRNRSTFKKAFKYVRERLASEDFNYNMEKKSETDKRIASFDYEIAERDEYSTAFCIDEKKGCLTHFSSNIYLNFVSYHLKPALDYSIPENRPFFHTYTKIKCISLLPPDLQLKGWHKFVKPELKRKCLPDFKPLLNEWIKQYFEPWYINGEHYQLSDWNFYLSHSRSQACIENQHKNWHQKIKSHPLIWPFVEFLQKEDALAGLRYEQIQQHGGKTRSKRVDEREKEHHLKRLWHLLNIKYVTISQFLSCAAPIIKMNWAVRDKLYKKYKITYLINSCCV